MRTAGGVSEIRVIIFPMDVLVFGSICVKDIPPMHSINALQVWLALHSYGFMGFGGGPP